MRGLEIDTVRTIKEKGRLRLISPADTHPAPDRDRVHEDVELVDQVV